MIDYEKEIRARICPGCPIYNTPTCNVQDEDLLECFDGWVENIEAIREAAKHLTDLL